MGVKFGITDLCCVLDTARCVARPAVNWLAVVRGSACVLGQCRSGEGAHCAGMDEADYSQSSTLPESERHARDVYKARDRRQLTIFVVVAVVGFALWATFLIWSTAPQRSHKAHGATAPAMMMYSSTHSDGA